MTLIPLIRETLDMTSIALTIFALALILANGVMGYAYFTFKERKIERNANERGTTMSDVEQEAIQKYRLQREKHMKLTLFGSIAMLMFLLLDVGNK